MTTPRPASPQVYRPDGKTYPLDAVMPDGSPAAAEGWERAFTVIEKVVWWVWHIGVRSPRPRNVPYAGVGWGSRKQVKHG